MNEENKPLKIFIGWDSREDIAYQVAKHSILKHATVPVEIIPLKQKQLRKDGWYTRPVDQLASTEFTFTRFLIPALTGHVGWALFIDCDFVFLNDVKKIFDQADNQYAVMCAQHDYTPKETIKMDGQTQHLYPRKNWSSMMLINCGHPSNLKLNKAIVNDESVTGAYLHRFSWLNDSEIGKLSHEWNWLVGWYKEPDDGIPFALHYTEGGPWFEQYQNCEYANEWYKIKIDLLEKTIDNKNKEIDNLYNKPVDIDDLGISDQKKKLIKSLLRYVIDPNEQFHKDAKKIFDEELEKSMGNKIAAIDSVGGINYHNKGYDYDTFLTSFILGSGGIISSWEKERETDNPLVIRGLGGGSRKAITHCWDTGRTFYAIDTGYFGNNKSKTWHRITKNNLQNLGPIQERNDNRLKRLNYYYKSFTPGKKILICPPSSKVMDLWQQPSPEDWTNRVIEELKKYTDRPIEIRLKPLRSERITTKTIEAALQDDVHCLITYNSIAATEALLNGKPAIALGPNAAQVLCNKKLSDVENLNIPTRDEMYAFVKHLSYCQFTEDEMRSGYAWDIVNESS